MGKANSPKNCSTTDEVLPDKVELTISMRPQYRFLLYKTFRIESKRSRSIVTGSGVAQANTQMQEAPEPSVDSITLSRPEATFQTQPKP